MSAYPPGVTANDIPDVPDAPFVWDDFEREHPEAAREIRNDFMDESGWGLIDEMHACRGDSGWLMALASRMGAEWKEYREKWGREWLAGRQDDIFKD